MDEKIFIVEIETVYEKQAVCYYHNGKVDFVSDEYYIDGNDFYDLDNVQLFSKEEADEIVAGLGGEYGILKPTKTKLRVEDEVEG